MDFNVLETNSNLDHRLGNACHFQKVKQLNRQYLQTILTKFRTESLLLILPRGDHTVDSRFRILLSLIPQKSLFDEDIFISL